ncbi:protein phosphatase 2C domain-containing protein [Streptomyces sp. 549]|uniref:protein phosphatase 2C domain-containing protein n=1 Tax=Streptomyces sp. 549 TaxID=3049076 RepID=UPI0024C33851|nr:protein phosphatase 2C domain-containing protein [Streptomyces sp. 549]MDK1475256.1 protein phosphatase 2C domain-containing protein [Streptomyces sp. 549]
MSGQRERAEAPDWWSQLYDDDAPDTGRSAAGDSIDDRFDSAARTVGVPGIVRQRPPDPPPRTPRGLRPGPAKGSPPPVRRMAAPPPADFLGDRPPTYDPEPTALPAADPEDLDALTPDTVLDGARYGPLTVRAASLRGDSARYRGRPRADALLVARFGSGDAALLLLAVAVGDRAAPFADRAARDAAGWIAGAVGRSHSRLSEDIRADRRAALKSGLGRLTARGMGRLRARAAELGLQPEEYTADLRCLLLPVDPRCRSRVFFGVGGGGLLRLRDGRWQDLEPGTSPEGPAADPRESPRDGEADEGSPGTTVTAGIPAQSAPDDADAAGADRAGESSPTGVAFRFRAAQARPGDVLLLCGRGFAEPLREEADFAAHLATRWTTGEPPGLADFLSDAQTRIKGYADDRTAAAVWES